MARLTRKQLKQDRFVEEVTEAVGLFTRHRKLITGAVVTVVLLVVAGVGFYRYQKELANEARIALQEALINYHGLDSRDSDPESLSFEPTIEEKEQKIKESLNKVAQDFAGRLEGEIARLHLALYEVSEGDPEEAKTLLEGFLDHADDEVSALARKALADQLQREGQSEEALKHYEHLVENPTEMLPKERIELFGLYDALLATDEQKALELVKSIEARNGAGREMAARLRAGLESRLGVMTEPTTPPAAPPPQS